MRSHILTSNTILKLLEYILDSQAIIEALFNYMQIIF